MKKLIIFFIGFTLMTGVALIADAKVNMAHITLTNFPNTQNGLGDSLDKYRNDPDWKIMADIQYRFINSLVTNQKLNIDNLDFSNETDFLNAIGMTKVQYLAQVSLNKEAARRFIKKFNITGSCKTCEMTYANQINGLKSAVKNFRANTNVYVNFTNSTLSGGGVGQTVAQACCGFWFYICCGVCALSIEAFPVYLACCTLCYTAECCSGGTS